MQLQGVGREFFKEKRVGCRNERLEDLKLLINFLWCSGLNITKGRGLEMGSRAKDSEK